MWRWVSTAMAMLRPASAPIRARPSHMLASETVDALAQQRSSLQAGPAPRRRWQLAGRGRAYWRRLAPCPWHLCQMRRRRGRRGRTGRWRAWRQRRHDGALQAPTAIAAAGGGQVVLHLGGGGGNEARQHGRRAASSGDIEPSARLDCKCSCTSASWPRTSTGCGRSGAGRNRCRDRDLAPGSNRRRCATPRPAPWKRGQRQRVARCAPAGCDYSSPSARRKACASSAVSICRARGPAPRRGAERCVVGGARAAGAIRADGENGGVDVAHGGQISAAGKLLAGKGDGDLLLRHQRVDRQRNRDQDAPRRISSLVLVRKLRNMAAHPCICSARSRPLPGDSRRGRSAQTMPWRQ